MRFGKIVCDPTSEEAKALIGKKVATYHIYGKLKEKPNECGVGILKDISVYTPIYNGNHYISVYDDAPFKMAFMDGHGCYCTTFIREIIE